MDKNKSQPSYNKKLVIGKKILVESENDNLDLIINSKVKNYKNIEKNHTDTNSETESEEEYEEEFEGYEELEKELDNKNTHPKNYGSKWSDSDKKKLLKYLTNSKYKIFYDSDDIMINKVASRLKRSVGGIKAEIRRVVFEKYICGTDIESISSELNIIFKDVKQIIKLHLEKESDSEINVLEKENKLLKLRIENIKLRDELKSMLNKN